MNSERISRQPLTYLPAAAPATVCAPPHPGRALVDHLPPGAAAVAAPSSPCSHLSAAGAGLLHRTACLRLFCTDHYFCLFSPRQLDTLNARLARIILGLVGLLSCMCLTRRYQPTTLQDHSHMLGNKKKISTAKTVVLTFF